jgi:hypothetical protein
VAIRAYGSESLKKRKTEMTEVTTLPIEALKKDGRNARKHTKRNMEMIAASIKEVGAARSGVVDEEDTILAGNGTFEALQAAGIKTVKVVETDGTEWVVVKRKGLTDEQKRIVALADNRAGELAEWDAPLLAAQGIDLAPWFNEAELFALNPRDKEAAAPEDFKEYGDDIATEFCCPKCGYEWSGKPK